MSELFDPRFKALDEKLARLLDYSKTKKLGFQHTPYNNGMMNVTSHRLDIFVIVGAQLQFLSGTIPKVGQLYVEASLSDIGDIVASRILTPLCGGYIYISELVGGNLFLPVNENFYVVIASISWVTCVVELNLTVVPL